MKRYRGVKIIKFSDLVLRKPYFYRNNCNQKLLKLTLILNRLIEMTLTGVVSYLEKLTIWSEDPSWFQRNQQSRYAYKNTQNCFKIYKYCDNTRKYYHNTYEYCQNTCSIEQMNTSLGFQFHNSVLILCELSNLCTLCRISNLNVKPILSNQKYKIK